MHACVRICACVPVSVRACVCACVRACVRVLTPSVLCDPDVTLDLGRLTHGIVLLGELNCMYPGELSEQHTTVFSEKRGQGCVTVTC